MGHIKSDSNTIVDILQKYYGYSSFRPKQEEIINAVLAGKDTLVLMPTGGGKSICFQLPALVLEGVTLVISPLIALMKDQVEALRLNGISAAFFNSSLTDVEKLKTIEQVKREEVKLLYMAPETLISTADTWLSEVNIKLIAVDEAHCVSMWGHDFRPEYTAIKQIRNIWPTVSIVALTATADKSTQLDIIEKLNLKSPKIFKSSFDRPNIKIKVPGITTKKRKISDIKQFIKQRRGESGIIYCLSRKETEELSNILSLEGLSVGYYHAGMDNEDRNQIQTAFIRDEIQIVVATVAFGMGIDKSNVRWVIHNNLPKNIEGYYQEIGRAGRDGLAAEARLYFNMRDVKLMADFAKESKNKILLLEKLNRIQQFAMAKNCRKKMLLNYFGENIAENCGNCDVCEHPPNYFDGTIYAQMALSGMIRAKEQISMNLLIQLLRGSKSMEVYDKNLHKIKTFGIGKKYSFDTWRDYIIQFINQGVIEISYAENFHLKVTDFGKSVLYKGKTVSLYKTNLDENQSSKSKSIKTDTVEVKPTDAQDLFEKLRKLRLEIAKREDVAAFRIFSDATLWDMVEKRPTYNQEMLSVSGVGNTKMELYGTLFLKAIKDFEQAKKLDKTTFETTLDLVKQGYTVNQMAAKRAIHKTTIYSHIAQLYKDNKIENIDIYLPNELEEEFKIHNIDYKNQSIQEIYELFDGVFEYGHIRLLVTKLEKT